MEFSERLFSHDVPFLGGSIKLPSGEIFQISELSVIRSGEIAEHKQYCDEITYAISGKAYFISDDERMEIRDGQVHFIKKGMRHKIVAHEGGNFRYICIGFTPDSSCGNIRSYLKMRDEVDWFIKNDDGSIRKLTNLMLNEFYIQDDQRDIMANLYLSQILISLSRIYNGNYTYIKKESSSNSNYAVYNALRYIDREYMYITSVKSVAEELSYSEYYLSHVFKEKMGISIKEYITKKKMHAAAELLKTSNLSIGELSEYLSFGSQHTFSQAFKRFYSVSPNEYRRN